MKKILTTAVLTIALVLSFAACDMGGNESSSSGAQSDAAKQIQVISREAGAGIRSVFATAFELVEEGADDLINTAATIKNVGKDVVSEVKNAPHAIAYAPLSQVTDDVKVLTVDSVLPNSENIKNGKYKHTLNLTAVTLKETSPEAEDFLSFILSKEGQEIITQQGLVSSSDTGAFSSKKPEGELKIYCADSYEEILEKLEDAYEKINDNLDIDIETKNSKTALENLKDKKEMAIITRQLSENEKDKFKENRFAKDAIAIIVNKENTRSDVSSKHIKEIFSGITKNWKDLT